MQNPFQIAFEGMDPSKAVETEVRAWLAKLSSLTDAARMMSGRMVIESVDRRGPVRNGNGVSRFCASLELLTLDADVVVTRGQDGNAAHEDVYVAVRNAFRLLRRQLVADSERRRLTVAVDVDSEALSDADSIAPAVADAPNGS